MASINLTNFAVAAMQYLIVIDAGEGLSTQQLADALAAANSLIANWANEQKKLIQITLTCFTLAGGTYTPATTPQFPDATTPITLPDEYVLPLECALAIVMAPQYAMKASPELIKTANESRAAASPVSIRLVGSAPAQSSPVQT